MNVTMHKDSSRDGIFYWFETGSEVLIAWASHFMWACIAPIVSTVDGPLKVIEIRENFAGSYRVMLVPDRRE